MGAGTQNRRRRESHSDPVTSAPVLSGNVRRARIAGLLMCGAVCVAAVACTAVTDGDPTANSGDAPAYRTSMSVSSSQSVASSRARESQRQESMTTRAVQTTCETLSITSADAIDAVNAYVEAFNADGGNTEATEGPAVDSLNQSADAVESSISDVVPDQVRDAFMEWVDGARATAEAIITQADPSEFNQVIDELNAARSDVLRLCDATY